MKLKFYLRGLGVGIVFTALIFSFIIVPKYKLSDSEIRIKARQLGMLDPTHTPTSGLEGLHNTGTPVPTSISEGPSASPSVSPSPTEAATLSPAPTDVETPSDTPVPTQSTDATATPIPTAEPTPTAAPTATNTPSPTPTKAPTNTPSPTPTKAPTNTPSPTPTKAPTNTPLPTPTNTPLPTPTSTPAPSPTQGASGEVITIQITAGMTSEAFSLKLFNAGLVDDVAKFNTFLIRNGYSERIRVGTFKFTKGMTYEQIAKTVAP